MKLWSKRVAAHSLAHVRGCGGAEGVGPPPTGTEAGSEASRIAAAAALSDASEG